MEKSKLKERTKLQNAQQIKGILIDYLIAQKPANIMIATEVPFISGRRWADVLLIQKNILHAFEIKSPLDTLAKLKAQTKDYLDTFDLVSLVISESHLKKVYPHITEYVGLMVIEDSTGKVRQIRVPKRRIRHVKSNLLDFLWRRDLAKAVRGKLSMNIQRTETVHLRKKAGELYSLKAIHKMAVEALIIRYSPRYKSFLNEKGKETLVQDLALLTTSHTNLLS
jgi:hypothetical protein